MKMAYTTLFGHGNMCYRLQEVQNGHTGHRGRKCGGWTEPVKMVSRHVFGHGNVCYRSQEVKNGLTPLRVRKRGSDRRHDKGPPDKLLAIEMCVTGHDNLKRASTDSD